LFCEDRYTEKTEQICYLQTTTEWGGTRGQIVGLIELNLQHFQQFQLGLCFERLRDYLSLKMDRQTKTRLSQNFRVMLLSRAFGRVVIMNGELQKI
jgi:hypothetical protein